MPPQSAAVVGPLTLRTPPPSMREPRVHEPRVREAQVHEPRVHEPRVHEPQVHEPRVHEPRVHEPQVHATVPVVAVIATRTVPMDEFPPLPRERDAFQAAIKPCLPRLYRFCLVLTGGSDADDLFQNALLKAFQRASDYSAKSDLTGWLCGIARNELLEQRRTHGRREGLLARMTSGWASVFGTGPGAAGAGPGPETSAMLNEESVLLLRCLARVPEEFREVLVLCDLEELGYATAAEMLGVPLGTVKSRHARGRAKLRAVYEALASRGDAPVAVRSEEEAT